MIVSGFSLITNRISISGSPTFLLSLCAPSYCAAEIYVVRSARHEMLHSTFAHIPGIGLRTERAIWAAGVTSWEHALDSRYCASRLSRRQAANVRVYIERSFAALASRDFSIFTRLARFGETWRVYPQLKAHALYLDIETTGLWTQDEITVIGTYARNRFRAFVAGRNLHEFPKYLRRFGFIVTFNGSCFDLPFIRRQFPSLRLPFHLDLRYSAKKCDLTGGLKEVERLLRIRRPSSVRGWDAVILWRKHRNGDKSPLKLLLEYNECDVRNLPSIAEVVCERLSELRTAELKPRARAARA